MRRTRLTGMTYFQLLFYRSYLKAVHRTNTFRTWLLFFSRGRGARRGGSSFSRCRIDKLGGSSCTETRHLKPIHKTPSSAGAAHNLARFPMSIVRCMPRIHTREPSLASGLAILRNRMMTDFDISGRRCRIISQSVTRDETGGKSLMRDFSFSSKVRRSGRGLRKTHARFSSLLALTNCTSTFARPTSTGLLSALVPAWSRHLNTRNEQFEGGDD